MMFFSEYFALYVVKHTFACIKQFNAMAKTAKKAAKKAPKKAAKKAVKKVAKKAAKKKK
jgi:hypothetical protein